MSRLSVSIPASSAPRPTRGKRRHRCLAGPGLAIPAIAVLILGCRADLQPPDLSDLVNAIGQCEVYDSNGDGIVTVEETRAVLAGLGLDPSVSDDALLDALQSLECDTGT